MLIVCGMTVVKHVSGRPITGNLLTSELVFKYIAQHDTLAEVLTLQR